MLIHSLFILKKTGACVYSKNFTENFLNIEPNLITPFFSAIFSFSENVISKKTPEILEMEDFRVNFYVDGDYIYALLADSSASLVYVKSRLKNIASEFRQFIQNNEVDEYELIIDNNFDIRIKSIIKGDDEISSSQALYRKVIEYMKNLVFGDEILGAAIFSVNGKVIYSSLPQNVLLSSLRELEIRFKVKSEFQTTFYSLDNQQKVFSKLIDIPWKLDPILIVVLYDSQVPLGMAEVNLEKIGRTISNII
jgi:hypothetical protein